jgi:hypothetical protein
MSPDVVEIGATRRPRFSWSGIFHQEQPDRGRNSTRFVSVLGAGRDMNAGALGVPREPASKINLQFAFQDQPDVPLFTPVRFDSLGKSAGLMHIRRAP